MQFWEVIKERRSIRQFDKKPVLDDKLKKVIEAATFAPSSCNEQLWKFIAVKKNLHKLVNECGVSKLVLHAPVTLFAFYYKSPFPQNIQSASAAVQNVLLAATNEGLGSLWIGGSGNHKKIKKILGVPNDYVLICQILLGYPKKKISPPPRKPVSEILTFEKFAGSVPKESHNPNKWTLKQIIEHQEYFCRKTTPGLPMMVINKKEINIIQNTLNQYSTKGKIVDLFSYDGSLLKYFPSIPYSIELSRQTAFYTTSAVNSNPIVMTEKLPFKDNSISQVTILFKLESIPQSEHNRIFKEAFRILKNGDKLIIISRTKYSLFGIVHWLIVKFFKDNIRKSGIFTFFGPYTPIKNQKNTLNKIGFSVESKNYYFIAPIFEDFYYLLKQYIKAKNTYLDSSKKKTTVGNILHTLAKLTKNIGFLGSINVTVAQKS